MKVIIDRNGVQANKHIKNSKRLKTFLELLKKLSIQHEFSGHRMIKNEELERCDLIIIATRYPKKFSKKEIKRIYHYVLEGGSLLLMSNHGDWPNKNLPDTRKYDAKLASKFEQKIEKTFFKNPLPRVKATLTRNVFNNDHTIIRGFENNPVQSIVINNCSSIKTKIGNPIVKISEEMNDLKNNFSYKNRYFAISLDERSELDTRIKGRVVITADSGLIGTRCTNQPGPGLIQEGDNSIFIRNTLLWLLDN